MQAVLKILTKGKVVMGIFPAMERRKNNGLYQKKEQTCEGLLFQGICYIYQKLMERRVK